MRGRIYIVALISLVLFGCNTSGDNNQQQVKVDTLQKERIIPIPENAIPKNASDEVFLESLTRIIGLPVITKGTEGLYIRIWLWDGEKKYVVSISQENAVNEFDIVEWNSKRMDSVENVIIHRELKHVQPKSGWESLWAAVNKYKITTLPNGKPYEEQERKLTEMAEVQFEIARPGSYRYYKYLEPGFYRYVDDGSKKVYEFLKYLNDELNLRVYNPAENLFVEPK